MPMHAIIYLAVLACIAALTARDGRAGLSRSALVTLGNCLVGTAAVLITGDYTPWPLFLALNIASAWAVLVEPAHKPQAVVAGMFVALACIDGVYGAIDRPELAWSYVFVSAVVGWGQLSVLAIGVLDDDNGTSRIARRFGGGAAADLQAYLKSMEARQP